MTAVMAVLDASAEDGRYHRQELISWWDQSRLRASRVLLVGAGALGNEIAKGLALVGVGHVEIVDMDVIEHSNLARCVLFHDGDEGRYKAEVVALGVLALNPEVSVTAHTVAVQRLGLGFMRGFDLVVAGLDNREARLWVGQSSRKLGITWIDGAIEGLRGLARVFLPEGACYECTLGETDRSIMSHRRACSLLSADEMVSGKVPTNATTASIIGGVEVQEAIKLLVGRDDLLALRNSAFMYTGEILDTYHVRYEEDEYCGSHDRYAAIERIEASPDMTLSDVFELGATRLGLAADALEFEDDFIVATQCPRCHSRRRVNRVRSALGSGDGVCSCDSHLTLEAVRSIGPQDELLSLRLDCLGLPLDDVITVRRGGTRVHFAVAATTERPC
jgi:molybdopterin/thiamine biosynthesis adenylyltransferase